MSLEGLTDHESIADVNTGRVTLLHLTRAQKSCPWSHNCGVKLTIGAGFRPFSQLYIYIYVYIHIHIFIHTCMHTYIHVYVKIVVCWIFAKLAI